MDRTEFLKLLGLSPFAIKGVLTGRDTPAKVEITEKSDGIEFHDITYPTFKVYNKNGECSGFVFDGFVSDGSLDAEYYNQRHSVRETLYIEGQGDNASFLKETIADDNEVTCLLKVPNTGTVYKFSGLLTSMQINHFEYGGEQISFEMLILTHEGIK